MTIDNMYRVRQLIDCIVCSDNDGDLCHKLLTPEQRNEYAAKYGCICKCCDCKCCDCKCCLNRRECDDD